MRARNGRQVQLLPPMTHARLSSIQLALNEGLYRDAEAHHLSGIHLRDNSFDSASIIEALHVNIKCLAMQRDVHVIYDKLRWNIDFLNLVKMTFRDARSLKPDHSLEYRPPLPVDRYILTASLNGSPCRSIGAPTVGVVPLRPADEVHLSNSD